MAAASSWGLIISGVLALGSVLGVILSRVGKREDVEQAQVSDQFRRMLEEVNYWQESNSRTRSEWEQRWDRQVDRCRRITDRLSSTVTNLAGQLSSGQAKEDAADALREVEDHREADHGSRYGSNSTPPSR